MGREAPTSPGWGTSRLISDNLHETRFKLTLSIGTFISTPSPIEWLTNKIPRTAAWFLWIGTYGLLEMNALEDLASTCDMENWFRDVGKTILLEALGDACDRVNSSFKTGIDRLHRRAPPSFIANTTNL